MAPEDFFRDAPFGSKIRYGGERPCVVTVLFIVRTGKVPYAHGIEEGTDRRVFLTLDGARIKDANRGFFDSVEVLE